MSETVRSVIDAWVRRRFGSGAEITHWGRLRRREWSWHLVFRVSGGDGGAMLVKIPRWEETPVLEDALQAGPQESTRVEFDMLRRIEEAVQRLGDPGVTAVTPLVYLDEVNGIVMRRFDGVPLRRRLGLLRGSAAAGALFDRLGRWLSMFHRFEGEVSRVPFPAAEETGFCSDLMERAKSADGAPRGLLDAIERLAGAADRMAGAAEPVGLAHCDMNLSNVLVGVDDRIAVVDPNAASGPALSDLARVITDARFERRQLLTAGVTRTGASVRSWQRRLADGAGYGEEPVLGYRLMRGMVERWCQVEEDARGMRRGVLGPARRLFRRDLADRFG